MLSRRSIRWPITLGVVLIVLVVALTVGWVIVSASAALKCGTLRSLLGAVGGGGHVSGARVSRRCAVFGALGQSHSTEPTAIEFYRCGYT